MTQLQSLSNTLDLGEVLDGLGQGVLIFDTNDQLVLDNLTAATILGANLVLVRAEGWPAAAMLLDAASEHGPTADAIRAKALRQAQPVRFHTFLSGTFTPCWAAGIHNADGSVYTMITLEHPDWSALTELMSTFRSEARMAITSTRGHAELIKQVIARRTPVTTADQLARQIGGFASIMAVHMYRLEILVDLLERLEDIRTGNLIQLLRNNRRPVELTSFIEDFLEDVLQSPLLEDAGPDAEYRDRIRVDIPEGVQVAACKTHLTAIFRDLLRNSLMYSEQNTPIIVRATPSTTSVQVDIIDSGYGIRAKEISRVFTPFQRARQPQIIAEFGYGLSLYLVKMEIEAMGGRIWFTSEERVGTTFSFKLPLWDM